MDETLPTTDEVASITVITENMTKHIRYLEANVHNLKNLPKLEDLKQRLWHMMCKPCRTTLFDFLSKDCSSRKKGGNVSHPLEDQETIKALEKENDTLRTIIKNKDKTLEIMEEEKKAHFKRPKRNYSESRGEYNKGVMNKKQSQLNDTGKHMVCIGHQKTEKHTKQNQTDSINRTNGDMSPPTDRLTKEHEERQDEFAEFDNVQKEKEENVREVAQQTERPKGSPNRNNEELPPTMTSLLQKIDMSKGELGEKQCDFDKDQKEKEEYVREVAQLQTERQTLADRISSLNRTNEELSSALKVQQQNVEKMTGELEKIQGDFDTVQKDKEEFVAQLSQLQTERQTLEDQTSSLTSTNEELSSTVEGLQRDIDRLTVELEKKQGDFDKSQREKEEYVREVAQLQTDRQTRQDQTSFLNKTNEELLFSLKIKQQNTEKMTGELEEKQTELDKVQKENEMFVIKISQLQTDIQTFKDQTSSLSRTNEEMTPVMEGLQRNIDRLIGQLEEKQGDFDKVQNEKAEYLKEQSQLQRDIQTLQDETGSLNKTIKELSSTVESLQPDIDRMTGELVKKDEEINNLKTVLEESRRLKKKVVVMRLLRTSRSGLGKTMVDMVTKELTRQLGERLDSKSFDFSIVLSETPTDVSNGPLFVLCLNMSRVGTNIQDALEGTKGGRDVYVLVLHHTNKDNLSTLTPTSLRVTGSELRQLGGIIDLAFSSNSGLYECDLNITAIGKIATVLKKF